MGGSWVKGSQRKLEYLTESASDFPGLISHHISVGKKAVKITRIPFDDRKSVEKTPGALFHDLAAKLLHDQLILFELRIQFVKDAADGKLRLDEQSQIKGLSNRFSVISSRACREELLHLFFPAGQVQVLPAG